MESVILTADSYGIVDTSPTAHLRGPDGLSLCGKFIRGPVPTGEQAWKDSLGYHTGQHCIDCDRQHRADTGTCAVTFDF